METRELICIGCPRGCPMRAWLEESQVTKVEGNTCRRGETYARKEVVNPTRFVTSTVFVKGGNTPMVSVKTARDIPREKIFECMEILRETVAEAPVQLGQVIVPNVAGTGVDVIATKGCEQKRLP